MEGKVIFITGIGTGVGKTIVSAIVTEALEADYWKPIQSGLEEETDRERVISLVSNKSSQFWEEAYLLNTPASPHLAARIDNVKIELLEIKARFDQIRKPDRHLVIEGAGGLMVPLNEKDFFPDLIRLLGAQTIAVSSQYLGNINHSLLTAEVLKMKKIPVLGWIYNGTYHVNEEDITRWSGFKKIGRIEWEENMDKAMIKKYADKLRPALLSVL